MKKPSFPFSTIAVLVIATTGIFAQGGGGLGGVVAGGREFPVTSAVPFLLINTDARSSGAGEISVVSVSDNQPFHFLSNPSLIVGKGNGWGVNMGYTSWLRELVDDIYLINGNAYFAFNKKNCLSYSTRYFTLGQTEFSNVPRYSGEFTPAEYALQLRYARLLSKHFSIGVGVKYIHSNLASGQTINSVPIEVGRSFAVDLGVDYRTEIKIADQFKYKLNAGLAILNFGTKITYTEDAEKDFIPINLNMGLLNGFKIQLRDSATYLQFNIGYQADKLMVPTPTPDDADSNGIEDFREQPLFKGAFTSFSDAPGGASEELREFAHHLGAGVEFVLKQKMLVATNIGVFLEDENNGNRKYFTWSLTAGCYGFHFDLSRLHSFADEGNPLDGTFKITVGYNMPLGSGPKLRYYN